MDCFRRWNLNVPIHLRTILKDWKPLGRQHVLGSFFNAGVFSFHFQVRAELQKTRKIVCSANSNLVRDRHRFGGGLCFGRGRQLRQTTQSFGRFLPKKKTTSTVENFLGVLANFSSRTINTSLLLLSLPRCPILSPSQFAEASEMMFLIFLPSDWV